MRKSILTFGSLLVTGCTFIVMFTIENLWGINLNLSEENNSKIQTQTNIVLCSSGTWLGTTSTKWNDASNWCNRVLPGPNVDVIIPSGGNQPIINTSAECRNITIAEGATLTIEGANTFKVNGDWNNNGVFNANTGTVIFGGSAQVISGINRTPFFETFYNLVLSGGTKEFNIPLQVNMNLTINYGAKCNLISGVSYANTLTLGEYGQIAGEWGGNSSSATFKNNNYFLSTTSGKLIVTNSTAIPGIWIGRTNDWATASNWSDGKAPTRLTDAIITATGLAPEINSAVCCKNLIIQPVSILKINDYDTLYVTKDWDNHGTFNQNSGTVIFDGADQVIGNETYKNLTLGGSGTKTVGEAKVSGVLSIEGTATLSKAIGYLASATLQYNSTVKRTTGYEWPSTIVISGIILKDTGVVSLNFNRSLNNTSLTIYEGATLDIKDFTLTPSAIFLQCGGKLKGSTIKGSKTLTLGGDLTVTNSGKGTAAAVIECPISISNYKINVMDGNPNAVDPTDLLINTIASGTLTKAGPGSMSIKDNGVLSILTIDEGTVIIKPRASLTIGNITNNAGPNGLLLLSDATGTGSLLVTGTASGSATLTRAMKSGAHHLVTSPLAGQTIYGFLTDPNNAVTIQSGQGVNADYRNMRDYNPTANNWNDFFKVGPTPTTGNIIPAIGYSIKVKNSEAHQIVFKGSLPTGDITLSGLTGGYWNCIGNPYTSAISINSSGGALTRFLENNKSNLDPAFVSVYVWDSALDPLNYIVKSNASDAYHLQQGQAFMVRMAPLKNSVSFNRTMQVHDVALALKSTDNIWPTINLMATADSSNSSTVIAFHDGMTNGLDPSYDAGLYKASSPIDLYTRLVDDYGIPFAIQALPSDAYDQLIIPVGVDYDKGGTVTFSAQGMYLPSSCRPIFEDRLTGIVTDLSDKTYTTDLMANNAGTGRFYLHTSYTTNGAATSDNENIFSAYFVNHRQLRIQGKPIKNIHVTLTDALGRPIISRQIKEEDWSEINIPTINPGIYLLQLSGLEVTQTLKLVAGN